MLTSARPLCKKDAGQRKHKQTPIDRATEENMSNLFKNSDGADAQAQATLAYLSGRDGIEKSWCSDKSRYMADPKVSRWENCREQGYVVVLRSEDYKRQLNIAFFEHRNSDNICAIKWEQKTMNSPTIDTAEFGDIYKDKYDVSKSLSEGCPSDMADWIYEQLEDFWKASSK